MREELYTKLNKYSKENVYPFHMPGHKRNIEYLGEYLPYHIDITEINDFDDLHHSEGILNQMQEHASNIFRSDSTFCLINGSTVGNIASLMAATEPGDTVLIARNCHNSIHTGIELNKLNAVYVYPEIIDEFGICGEIKLESIIKELDEYGDKLKAVVIVSPTYEGVISDIKAIAEEVHKYNIPLIVDEAHGAHLGLHPYFKNNANEMGADVVVHSIHKTLPALTQTALLHVNSDRINKTKVAKYLKMLQSSSPSYILMAGISKCLEIITSDDFTEKMEAYVENLELARSELKNMKHLELVETNSYDKGKIVINAEKSNMTSDRLFKVLREEYQLELEMDGMSYVIAMTSVADTPEGIERLVIALLQIDREIAFKFENPECNDVAFERVNDRIENIELKQKAFHDEMEKKEQKEIKGINYNIAEIFVKESNKCKKGGQVSENFYYLYPPGIPIIVPGENITVRHKLLMEAYRNRGYIIRVR